jgi:hypothetical protein
VAAAEETPAPAEGAWAEQPPAAEDGFESPFADEFDVPAFLRRKQRGEETAADRELPAFLRRSAD